MNITTINPAYLSKAKRLYTADRKYCAQVDTYHAAMDEYAASECYTVNGEYRLEEKQTRMCEKLWQRIWDIAEDMPARELKHLDRIYKAFHGYESCFYNLQIQQLCN